MFVFELYAFMYPFAVPSVSEHIQVVLQYETRGGYEYSLKNGNVSLVALITRI